MPDIVEIAAQVDVDDACLVLNDRSRHTVHRFMGKVIDEKFLSSYDMDEPLLVLTEAETAKPPADIHCRAPHGFAGYSLSRGSHIPD